MTSDAEASNAKMFNEFEVPVVRPQSDTPVTVIFVTLTTELEQFDAGAVIDNFDEKTLSVLLDVADALNVETTTSERDIL